MTYTPHTDAELQEMLDAVGLESLSELFASVPEEIRMSRPLNIPARRTETEILRQFSSLASRNRAHTQRPNFLGAGCYHRFVPAAVDYLASRGEFNTAYTPYQPEVSQGTLQAIFEYQSMICRLTGMEISNASMYEGATALAEAVLMTYGVKPHGNKVAISAAVHPEYRSVLETYVRHHALELVNIPVLDGRTDLTELKRHTDDETIAVVMQSPNFFGLIEDGKAIAQSIGQSSSDAAGDNKDRPFLIAVVDPISLAVLKPPGEYGADIAVGEGQQLGNPMSYGGPSFGFFATRMQHVRKVPGRIIGETKDRDGKRGYVLTFQTREQHIRREKATSNICTNQGLCCLRGAMYLALLGEAGVQAVASSSARKAHYAYKRLTAIAGTESTFGRGFFNEFALRFPLPAAIVYERLDNAGIGGGLDLGRYYPEYDHDMLFSFTELTTLEEIEQLATTLEQVCQLTSAPLLKEPQGVEEAARA